MILVANAVRTRHITQPDLQEMGTCDGEPQWSAQSEPVNGTVGCIQSHF